jgi:PAS domain S-box-containing protein
VIVPALARAESSAEKRIRETASRLRCAAPVTENSAEIPAGLCLREGGLVMSLGFEFDRFCQVFAREMPDALIYADREGVIRFWNGGAERIFGFGEADAVGRSLEIVIPQNLRARHWEGFGETMRTGKTRYGAGAVLAVPALRKDGARISIEFTVLPFRDDAGHIIGIAATLRDVTERFEEMRTLRRQLAQRGG